MERLLDPGSWARAYGGAVCTGQLRSTPADFIVDEQLPFLPDGRGEHVLLHVEKELLTTHAVRDHIARIAGCRQIDVGFCGLKDKVAVTRQWFSVHLAGKAEPDWQLLEKAETLSRSGAARVSVLAVERHGRKLRRAAHSGNRFKLKVAGVVGNTDRLAEQLVALGAQGIPNYFGEQRFGVGGANLQQVLAAVSATGRRERALKQFRRDKRGMLFSAARSALFNDYLSQRIDAGNWCSYVDGDRLVLEGSRSHFSVGTAEGGELDDVARRLREGDIHVSGVLWGRGDESSQYERNAAEAFAPLVAWLDDLGLELQRRALRARVDDLVFEFDGDGLHLAFGLPVGSYATSLLREVISPPLG